MWILLLERLAQSLSMNNSRIAQTTCSMNRRHKLSLHWNEYSFATEPTLIPYVVGTAAGSCLPCWHWHDDQQQPAQKSQVAARVETEQCSEQHVDNQVEQLFWQSKMSSCNGSLATTLVQTTEPEHCLGHGWVSLLFWTEQEKIYDELMTVDYHMFQYTLYLLVICPEVPEIGSRQDSTTNLLVRWCQHVSQRNKSLL